MVRVVIAARVKMMNSVCYYLHKNYAGSYYVPCEIVAEHPDGEVTIEFFDPIAEEQTVRRVTRKSLRDTNE